MAAATTIASTVATLGKLKLQSQAVATETAVELSTSIKKYVRRRMYGDPKGLLDLSNEILVDEIIQRMYVEDVLSLRRTNKSLYVLTHTPIIWRRILERINIPFPTMRPTFNYHLDQTAFEIEQFVTRTISIDMNWRHPKPVIRETQKVFAQSVVLEMKLLPGGKFLAASTTNSDHRTFSLTLYALDHNRANRAICSASLPYRAHNLQAKYMSIGGKPVIVTAFVTRRYASGKMHPGMNLNEVSLDVENEAPEPILTEVNCYCTLLEAVETLINLDDPRRLENREIMKKYPRSFAQVPTNMHSEAKMNVLSLFEMSGRPYLVAVEQPCKVLFMDLACLARYDVTVIDYEQWGEEHTIIHAITNLPGQREAILLRSMKAGTMPQYSHDYHCTETFLVPTTPVPAPTPANANPSHRVPVKSRNRFLGIPPTATRVSFSFAEHKPPIIGPNHPNLLGRDMPPSPLGIFAQTRTPGAVYNWSLWPTRTVVEATDKTPAKTRWRMVNAADHMALQTERIFSSFSEPGKDTEGEKDEGAGVPVVFPGTDRSFVYLADADDRSMCPRPVKIFRYLNPEYGPGVEGYRWPAAQDEGLKDVMRRPRMPLGESAFAEVEVPGEVRAFLDGEAGTGRKGSGKGKARKRAVGAMTWDDGVGRLCVSMEKEEKVLVVDFSSWSRVDEMVRRWSGEGEVRDDYFVGM